MVNAQREVSFTSSLPSLNNALLSQDALPLTRTLASYTLQSAAYGRGLSFVDTFVTCSADWWAITVAALQPSW